MNLKSLFLAGLHCYSRLKANRQVIFNGETLSLKQLARRFPTSTFDHKHDAYIKAIEVYLTGCGQIKLLFVRKDKHEEEGSTKFILCTDLGASAPQILLRYRSRWAIETVFRDIKQNLNFETCQARALTMQESHIALSLFAFVVLELQPALSFNNTVAQTIGEKKELLSSLLLIKQQKKFYLLDTRSTNAIPLSLQGSSFDRVLPTLDFAFKIINYQGAANAA
jgi:transposase